MEAWADQALAWAKDRSSGFGFLIKPLRHKTVDILADFLRYSIRGTCTYIVGSQANGMALWTLVEDNSSLHVVMWEGIHKLKFERPASFTFNHQVGMVSLVPTVEL